MGYLLGVEGGGSHAHAVVVDERGMVHGVGGIAESANWEDVGIEAASAALRACAREALAEAGISGAQVTASVFGLAGVDFAIDESRLSGIPEALGLRSPARILNDAFVALRAGTDQPFGVVVVAGTGSVVAGRNAEGRAFRTLGLGPTFGDSGSASEVSAAGITAVARSFIGTGPSTTLGGLLCAETGVPSVAELLEATARGRIDDSRFAHLVVRAGEDGDRVAAAILARAGERLVANVAHVVARLGMRDAAFDAVLAGGLFRSGSHFLIGAVERGLARIAPGARPTLLRAPAVVGSALLAGEAVRVRLPDGSRERIAAQTSERLGLRG